MAAAAAAASAPRLLLPPAASTFPHQHEHVRRNWHRPRRQVISARAGASVAARGLDADDFRHPLDKQVNSQLICYCLLPLLQCL